MEKVTLEGFIDVPIDDLKTVEDELPRHMELTMAEAGCLVFEVTRDKSFPTRFNVYEEFDSESSFQYHQARVSSSAWGKVTKNVTRHYTIKNSGE